MSSAAYQFSAGHRIRLRVSGGAHPRYARNTGTADPQATATRLVPTDIQILHDAEAPCALTLFAADAHSPTDALAQQRTARQ
jgi:predicted acyl esterase